MQYGIDWHAFPREDILGKLKSASSRDLLGLADLYCKDETLLQRIYAVLSERKNEAAFDAAMHVGRLLQSLKDAADRQKVEHQRTLKQTRQQRRDDGYFDWPTTDAPASKFGFKGDNFFYKDGLLSYVGYSAGVTAPTQQMREDILDCVFYNQIPRVISPQHMLEWGAPKSPERLRKMANCLATFTRNAKRKRTADYGIAIGHWESDLDYLYRTYYIGRFQFAWAVPDDDGY
jgi:hypothetical protein